MLQGTAAPLAEPCPKAGGAWWGALRWGRPSRHATPPHLPGSSGGGAIPPAPRAALPAEGGPGAALIPGLRLGQLGAARLAPGRAQQLLGLGIPPQPGLLGQLLGLRQAAGPGEAAQGGQLQGPVPRDAGLLRQPGLGALLVGAWQTACSGGGGGGGDQAAAAQACCRGAAWGFAQLPRRLSAGRRREAAARTWQELSKCAALAGRLLASNTSNRASRTWREGSMLAICMLRKSSTACMRPVSALG